MNKHFFLFSILFLLSLSIYSCKPADEKPAVTSGYVNLDIKSRNSDGIYLDIPSQEIVNTSIKMEYSTNGGNSWTSCSGAIQYLPGLSVGDHVMVRDISNHSWVQDLGSVAALTGRPDFVVGSSLFIGEFENNNGNIRWDDLSFYSPGENFDCMFGFENKGIESEGVHIYLLLSEDKDMDPATDRVMMDFNYEYAIPGGGEVGGWKSEMKIPSETTPGTHYLGLYIDSLDTVSELNEGNNITLAENLVPIYISDTASSGDGAFKIANSWGSQDYGEDYNWENKFDGFYWMPYQVMKDNNMAVFFYQNNSDINYSPTLLAVFKISHAHRDEVKITFGAGDHNNPIVEKIFSPAYGLELLGGPQPFPDDNIVLDISELAYAINDGNLYIKIENAGGTSGTLDNFSIELYDGAASPFDTRAISSSQSFGNETLFVDIATAGQITSTDLDKITLSPDSSITSLNVFTSDVSSSQSAKDLASFGTRTIASEPYKGRFGTGYIAPSAEEFASMRKITGISTTEGRAAYGGNTLPMEVDLSASIHFPPIGNQGAKGSCATFTLAYYMQTYTEAKKRGWDLSTVQWDETETTYSAFGQPSGMLDKIFSPDFVYPQINNGIDGGSNMHSAIRILQTQGSASFSTVPYVSPASSSDITESDYSTWPSENAWREAPRYRAVLDKEAYFPVLTIGYFVIRDDSDIQMLKTMLAKGYVIGTTLPAWTVYNSFSSQDVVSNGVSWTSEDIDHAQTIVGYKEGTEWDPSAPDN